jgi:hypothetical protein
MNAVGMNTAASTAVMTRIGPVTSFIAASAAARGFRPRARCRSTFSTTTIASSTTMPIDSTRPNRLSVLSVKPAACITASVPTSDTGTAAIGISDARQLCRNSSTTSTTRTIASASVWMTLRIEALTNSVGS